MSSRAFAGGARAILAAPRRSARGVARDVVLASGATTTGKHQRRRQGGAIVLRRGHFKRLDEIERPPWDLTLHAEIHQMAMDEHDALNPERGPRGRVPGVDDDDEEEEDDDDATSASTGVTLSAEVSPVGHGFFVDGEIESRAVVECDRCGCAHVGLVRAPVKAWLDERAGNEDDGGGEYEVVPFPVTRDECDLTALARDLLRMNAPYETLCDACVNVGGTEADEDGFVFRLEPED